MKRIFPLGLIALGILLSFGALVSLYLNNRAPLQLTDNLPSEVADLPLTNSKSGKEAVAEFTSLHNEEFPIISGTVATYGNGAITLWVAVTSSDSIAAQLVSDMQSKISEGNSPFSPINEIQDVNRKVYVLDGMGQKHYYFQSKDRVIWLASQPQTADQAIQQILEVYP